ncbi:carbohydrate-binding module family 48 protein [Phycomyces blakesleeanus]|uniref:Carbohydrate-binding module family 48 protein n=2 Tax=Phycomyces blakesleeanus TaxID=4837 RepID=A0A167L4C4_PHYB8|nr:carbohydrate-binding module family 48 protein [Phycomyces blakesleeanus NRRL 1555(-)]OAD69568.1 carbohydrate-binding module family 48 protein [Phycomyces blakesleeanus NRRL 1555(-)]|eukprot:XP_018287608.1 carbohydrate-binding module family 48 protein [Phycomyces blakesleeanus NRRL 1555(-)]
MRDWLVMPAPSSSLTYPVGKPKTERDIRPHQHKRQQPVRRVTSSWRTVLSLFGDAETFKQQQRSQSTPTLLKNAENIEQVHHFVIEEEPESVMVSPSSASSFSAAESVVSTAACSEHSPLGTPEIKQVTETEDTLEVNTPVELTEFRWSFAGQQVYVTGTFDNWGVSLPMTKAPEASYFVASIPLDRSVDIEFKFVVDGIWSYAADLPHCTDNHGNVNNVFYAKAK